MKPSQSKSRSKAQSKPQSRPGKPSALSIGFLMLWHGALSGGFLVAMLTGEGAYNAHVFAGIVVIFAIGFRLLLGTAVPKTHVLSFPLPKFATLIQGSHGVRRFISHAMGLAMLVICALAALTGWYTRHGSDAHGALSYFALSLIGVHVALVVLMQGWKKVEIMVQGKPKTAKT